MFPEAVRAVREVRPRAFIFENVKGLLRETFTDYFEYVYLQLTHPNLTREKGRAGRNIAPVLRGTIQRRRISPSTKWCIVC